ncbi:hypothetical protein [Arthrobacter sp. NtRootA1]|nr:hypothetical protein [Arthrobacter sp. NtRootA1]BCW06412.1 hypothetical protein NtRootA1_25500 [Arthrobacter sp. NtRootA1]
MASHQGEELNITVGEATPELNTVVIREHLLGLQYADPPIRAAGSDA